MFEYDGMVNMVTVIISINDEEHLPHRSLQQHFSIVRFHFQEDNHVEIKFDNMPTSSCPVRRLSTISYVKCLPKNMDATFWMWYWQDDDRSWKIFNMVKCVCFVLCPHRHDICSSCQHSSFIILHRSNKWTFTPQTQPKTRSWEFLRCFLTPLTVVVSN